MTAQASSTEAAGIRARIVAETLSWEGTPYRHQASLKGVGCDCLGLVRGVWRAVYGAEPEAPPAYSADWAEATKEETLLDAATRHMVPIAAEPARPDEIIAAARPGDMLLFRFRPRLPAKHAAIVIAPGRIIHAYDAAGRVAASSLVPEWRKRVAAAFAFPDLSAASAVKD